MFSFRAPLLPFLPSRGLLPCRGTLYALCLAPFCRIFGGFVCLLCAVLLLSPVPVSRLSHSSCLCLSSSSLSLCLLPCAPFRSLSRTFFAIPCGILYCLVFLFGSFFLFCALASGPPGMSAVEASSTFARTASSSSIVAAASSSSFWFSPLAIFFVVLFSWRGFAGVLWCWHVLSFSYFTCFNLCSMVVPSLTAGSEYPSGKGGGGVLAFRRLFFIEGFREWHFNAQWSPGLANSL